VLYQRADLALVSGPLDEVTLPVAGHQPLADPNGALLNAGGPRTEATAVDASAARAAGLVTTGQQRQYLGAQLASGHGVQGGVDGLVTDANKIGHAPQYAAGLVGGKAPRKDSSTRHHRALLVTILRATRGSRARRWARCSACAQRQPPAMGGRPGTDAEPVSGRRPWLRENSRVMVEGARLGLRATARKPKPCSSQTCIKARSSRLRCV
jgi:hypothetical protein